MTICNETVAVMKEYNIKRHYVTRHVNTYEKFEGQVRKDKFQNLKKSIKAQQNVFIRASGDTLSHYITLTILLVFLFIYVTLILRQIKDVNILCLLKVCLMIKNV